MGAGVGDEATEAEGGDSTRLRVSVLGGRGASVTDGTCVLRVVVRNFSGLYDVNLSWSYEAPSPFSKGAKQGALVPLPQHAARGSTFAPRHAKTAFKRHGAQETGYMMLKPRPRGLWAVAAHCCFRH